VAKQDYFDKYIEIPDWGIFCGSEGRGFNRFNEEYKSTYMRLSQRGKGI